MLEVSIDQQTNRTWLMARSKRWIWIDLRPNRIGPSAFWMSMKNRSSSLLVSGRLWWERVCRISFSSLNTSYGLHKKRKWQFGVRVVNSFVYHVCAFRPRPSPLPIKCLTIVNIWWQSSRDPCGNDGPRLAFGRWDGTSGIDVLLTRYSMCRFHRPAVLIMSQLVAHLCRFLYQ